MTDLQKRATEMNLPILSGPFDPAAKYHVLRGNKIVALPIYACTAEEMNQIVESAEALARAIIAEGDALDAYADAKFGKPSNTSNVITITGGGK
jgi:hypothetical protein